MCVYHDKYVAIIYLKLLMCDIVYVLHLLISCIHCVCAIIDPRRMRCGVTVVVLCTVCVCVSVCCHGNCY